MGQTAVNLLSKIPLHFRPFKAKAEIARLQDEAAKTKMKLEAVYWWISETHGLAGLRTADGKTVDLLKLNKKNENKIAVAPTPDSGSAIAGG